MSCGVPGQSGNVKFWVLPKMTSAFIKPTIDCDRWGKENLHSTFPAVGKDVSFHQQRFQGEFRIQHLTSHPTSSFRRRGEISIIFPSTHSRLQSGLQSDCNAPPQLLSLPAVERDRKSKAGAESQMYLEKPGGSSFPRKKIIQMCYRFPSYWDKNSGGNSNNQQDDILLGEWQKEKVLQILWKKSSFTNQSKFSCLKDIL